MEVVPAILTFISGVLIGFTVAFIRHGIPQIRAEMKRRREHAQGMSVKEFREQGYLQEVNRQMLHPCGLALSVVVERNGDESFGPIWDYRHDPEGIVYATGELDAESTEKKRSYFAEFDRHAPVRRPVKAQPWSRDDVEAPLTTPKERVR